MHVQRINFNRENVDFQLSKLRAIANSEYKTYLTFIVGQHKEIAEIVLELLSNCHTRYSRVLHAITKVFQMDKIGGIG